jgi:AraC family transcriptional regulator
VNCFERTEEVIDHLERHLGEDLDYERIARLAGCPIGLYQRVFAYVAGLSLAQYQRRRRLSEAARELMAGKAKVIDLALKYGYESHGAFARAFKEQFGRPPSAALRGSSTIELFDRLSFSRGAEPGESYRVVNGRRIMAELIRIDYADFGPRRLVGKEWRTSFEEAGSRWGEYFGSGWSGRVEGLSDRFCRDIDDYVALGHMSRFSEDGKEFSYLIGKYVLEGSPVPEGLDAIDVPAGTVALARLRGTLVDIIEHAYFLVTEAIERNGRRVAREGFYWCDVYTYARYCEPVERGEKVVTLDYFMPCGKPVVEESAATTRSRCPS